jgi:hypothetical protein
MKMFSFLKVLNIIYWDDHLVYVFQVAACTKIIHARSQSCIFCSGILVMSEVDITFVRNKQLLLQYVVFVMNDQTFFDHAIALYGSLLTIGI